MPANPDPDDGWGDLARELGLDPPPARLSSHTAPPVEPEADAEPDGTPFSATDATPEVFHRFEPNGDDAEPDDDGTDEAAEGDTDGEPDGEGPKKKKRRRRRRKKRNGDAPDAAAPTAEAADGDDGDGDGDADDDEQTGDEPEADTGDDETTPATEAARELVANWDVPSWEQIVAGLYRPGGSGR